MVSIILANGTILIILPYNIYFLICTANLYKSMILAWFDTLGSLNVSSWCFLSSLMRDGSLTEYRNFHTNNFSGRIPNRIPWFQQHIFSLSLTAYLDAYTRYPLMSPLYVSSSCMNLSLSSLLMRSGRNFYTKKFSLSKSSPLTANL